MNTTLTHMIARVSTGLFVAGILVGGATPALASTSDIPAVRTVAVSTVLADNGSPEFQNGIRKGTLDGNRDGFNDAKTNCQRANRAKHHNNGFAPSPFDDGYVQGYSIGYNKGFDNAEGQFCHKGGNEGQPASAQEVSGTFEATGTDQTADNIVTDRPGKTTNEFAQNLPFHRNFTAAPDADLLQVVVTGRGQVACKITFGGRVVATDSGEFTAHCLFRKN